MIVTRSYVRKLEFCNLIGAFTFQYAAILLDQDESHQTISQVGGVWERPTPPGWEGSGNELLSSALCAWFKGHAYIIAG